MYLEMVRPGVYYANMFCVTVFVTNIIVCNMEPRLTHGSRKFSLRPLMARPLYWRHLLYSLTNNGKYLVVGRSIRESEFMSGLRKGLGDIESVKKRFSISNVLDVFIITRHTRLKKLKRGPRI